MSFTQNLKAQLCKPQRECPVCQKSELSAIIEVLADYSEKGVTVIVENEDVAERIRSLIEAAAGIDFEYKNRNGVFKFCFDNSFFFDVLTPKILMGGEKIPKKECCRGAYIRGAFLASGSVSDPKKQYHMEFGIKTAECTEKLCRILKRAGVFSKVTERKGRNVVYIKDYSGIADCLGVMGAVGTAMDIYNISIEKELRNRANRQSNCEVANIEKTTKAASYQLGAIKKIEKKIGLSELPEHLRKIAILRREYPDESLKELGMRLNPPIGKSGVNHRLKRIEEIAKEL